MVMGVPFTSGLRFELEPLLQALCDRGYYIVEDALEDWLLQALCTEAHEDIAFRPASIGRGTETTYAPSIRNDEIAWMKDNTAAQALWIQAMSELQSQINRSLFMGLFSFECHFAHYAPGHFYQKHFDAFRGASNRRLSLVTYLNPEWEENWGGELVMYDGQGRVLQKILPRAGTLALFLSEDFEHEVLPATHDRFSIAGWFRVNSSQTDRVDPPR